jgi:hypothetical protein
MLNFDDVSEFFRTTFSTAPAIPGVPRHAQSIETWAKDAGIPQ